MSSPDEFDAMITSIDHLVALVENRYQTTNATAAECLDQLTHGPLDLGMEPDCVALWQVLNQIADEEASTTENGSPQ